MTTKRPSAIPNKTVLVTVLIIGLATGGVSAIRYALNELNSDSQQTTAPTELPPTQTTAKVSPSSTEEPTDVLTDLTNTDTPVPTLIDRVLNTKFSAASQPVTLHRSSENLRTVFGIRLPTALGIASGFHPYGQRSKRT